ncbi:DNA photolyase family protein [Hellea sp.]|nr:DNA photolyase family protein [Hellea sp.]
MSKVPIIVWFRRDLRVADNPALSEAAKTGRPVICLYVFETDKERELGGASHWWLHHSLESLTADLKKIGAKLILRKGQAYRILDMLIEDTGADSVYWNRRYEENPREIDTAIKSDLTERGLTIKSFRANLLSEPWSVETKTGGYYKVFTPYWRMAQESIDTSKPLPAPKKISSFEGEIKSEALESFKLLPTSPDWGSKMSPYWTIGSKGAAKALKQFLDGPVSNYSDDRNRPDKEDGTSKLSPHLAFGEISPKQIWQACKGDLDKARKFLSEIGWREFSYVLLYHNPKLASENYKSDFDAFEWNPNEENLRRWQKGQTGYPFVDAGMRQLWQTGWQHNRVRMVTASFLIKHLLIDWREGEKWFHDTLVDADPASNAASWQWVAGSGADAAPYFRIFNPFTQGEKFDPNGDYVRKFVPELKHLPNKFIHRPWDAPALVLKEAGVNLGESYPKPIVDHKVARERALAAYKATRE